MVGGDVEPFDVVVVAAEEADEGDAKIASSMPSTTRSTRAGRRAAATPAPMHHGGDAQRGRRRRHRRPAGCPRRPDTVAKVALPTLTAEAVIDAARRPAGPDGRDDRAPSGGGVESALASLAGDGAMADTAVGCIDDRRMLVWKHHRPTRRSATWPSTIRRSGASWPARQGGRTTARLQQLALHDELTGRADTRYFRQFLARISTRPRSTGSR